jgi:hypothetical protein
MMTFVDIYFSTKFGIAIDAAAFQTPITDFRKHLTSRLNIFAT